MNRRRPERRKHFRKQLDFGTNIVQVNNVVFQMAKWGHEYGIDLSPEGCCLCSTRKLPKEAQVRCLLLFRPPYDEQLVEVAGRLVWQQQRHHNGESLWFHGLKFEGLPTATTRFLQHMSQCTYEQSAKGKP